MASKRKERDEFVVRRPQTINFVAWQRKAYMYVLFELRLATFSLSLSHNHQP
jgi:hypothetical protein